ncbi:histamine H2 receptor-like [Octopus bimaculoides]|uniref:histamine H2 receptor-like n=1 Tax=Octopus bimaculoides TaxID=37653 RepID=UPI00071E4006|nr:histamine H2 receptor-like [Octopus bimaculoides]|eukprot:XP_014789412.1 PREDICTED: histamine H2 receptor-like [Octopus bimaculoides]
MRPDYFEIDWDVPIDFNWTLDYQVEETEVTVNLAEAVGSFILAGCVVLFNGLLLLAILLQCTKTKLTTIQILIANNATIDLLQGVLINPFHGYQAFSEWKLSRIWCEIWSTLEPTVFVVSALCLLCVNIDRLMYVSNPEKYTKHLNVNMAVILTAAPWILGCSVIPPLYILGEDTSFLKPPKAPLCILIPKQEVIRTIFTLCSIIGTAILVIFLVIFCLVSRSQGIRSYGLVKDIDGNSIRNKIMALCSVNVFFFILRFPWIYSPHIIQVVCENIECDKHKLDVAHALLMWISHCGFAINPLAWTVDRDIRNAYGNLFLCKACFQTPSETRRSMRQARNCKNEHSNAVGYRYSKSLPQDIEASPTINGGVGHLRAETYEMTN